MDKRICIFANNLTIVCDSIKKSKNVKGLMLLYLNGFPIGTFYVFQYKFKYSKEDINYKHYDLVLKK